MQSLASQTLSLYICDWVFRNTVTQEACMLAWLWSGFESIQDGHLILLNTAYIHAEWLGHGHLHLIAVQMLLCTVYVQNLLTRRKA